MDPVSLCNLALGNLGSKPIASLDDPSRAAQLCRDFYEPLRDVVTEARDWTFATSRFALDADADAPPFGYLARFSLPSTVLRVITCEPPQGQTLDAFAAQLAYDDGLDLSSSLDWVKEGHFILTREEFPSVQVKAIVQVEDPSEWSPGFTFALAARLTAELAVPLTENATLKTAAMQEYLLKLRDAAADDGRQGRSQRRHFTGSALRRR